MPSKYHNRPAEPLSKNPRFINHIGKTYFRLTVSEYCGKTSQDGDHLWRCECECGNVVVVQAKNLFHTYYPVKSCGCLYKETRHSAKATHGLSRTPEYAVWLDMRRRCSNPNSTNYSNYGGRGITVCERWLDFTNFFADMGQRPTAKHEIDRRDNDGNYEPDNCYWATRYEQSIHKRSTRWVEYNGERLALVEWCRRLNIPYSRTQLRLNKGLSVVDAFHPDTRPNHPLK